LLIVGLGLPSYANAGPTEVCNSVFAVNSDVANGGVLYGEIVYSSGPYILSYGFNENVYLPNYTFGYQDDSNPKDVYPSLVNTSGGSARFVGNLNVVTTCS
jgi:hypothetical protein